jgi:hypothetical protein
MKYKENIGDHIINFDSESSRLNSINPENKSANLIGTVLNGEDGTQFLRPESSNSTSSSSSHISSSSASTIITTNSNEIIIEHEEITLNLAASTSSQQITNEDPQEGGSTEKTRPLKEKQTKVIIRDLVENLSMLINVCRFSTHLKKSSHSFIIILTFLFLSLSFMQIMPHYSGIFNHQLSTCRY